jgi:Uma2 family endonuclease
MAAVTASAPATEQTAPIPVSAEEYLARFAEEHYEWTKGAIVKMSPISLKHAELVDYLRDVLKAYFALNPIGRVLGEPFVMRLDAVESIREPDLQVILHTNSGQLTDTAMIGPADICIEVVSQESTARDYGEKFEEYEKAGVGEHWILDPIRHECRFHQLQESKLYSTVRPDSDGYYRTPRLPHLALHVPTLWQEKLPDIFAIGETVRAMVEGQ